MQIKVTNEIKDYEGKPVEDMGQPLTIRGVVVNSLNMMRGPEQPTADEKNVLYNISKKFWGSSKVSITLDEATIIKEKVSLAYNPLVYGRICDLLDGTEEESDAGEPTEEELTSE